MQRPILVYHPTKADQYAAYLETQGVLVQVVHDRIDFERGMNNGSTILFAWRFPWQWIQAGSTLTWIQLMGAGADDIIHHSYVMNHQTVTRVLDQFGAPIAEYVFAWILYLSQGIDRLRQAQQQKLWNPFVPQSISDKTLAIAGLGSIGKEIAKRGQAFSMKVIGLSRTHKDQGVIEAWYQPDDWSTFAQQADYLVLALPLTQATYHVLDEKILQVMKKDVIVINIGRGQLINEEDLQKALLHHRIQGAILDVLQQEPLPKEHPFWHTEGIYITPHMSGVSQIEKVSDFFRLNLLRYERSQPLQGIVDPLLNY